MWANTSQTLIRKDIIIIIDVSFSALAKSRRRRQQRQRIQIVNQLTIHLHANNLALVKFSWFVFMQIHALGAALVRDYDQSGDVQWQQQDEHDRRTCFHCSLIKSSVCISRHHGIETDGFKRSAADAQTDRRWAYRELAACGFQFRWYSRFVHISFSPLLLSRMCAKFEHFLDILRSTVSHIEWCESIHSATWF